MEVVVGSAYRAVAVMGVAEEEKAVVVGDKKSLTEAVEVVGEVEDRVSQAAEVVEELEDRVSLAVVVADHMDSHILSTFHIPSAFSLLYSTQQNVKAKAE